VTTPVSISATYSVGGVAVLERGEDLLVDPD
jgi:hypothetical protein